LQPNELIVRRPDNPVYLEAVQDALDAPRRAAVDAVSLDLHRHIALLRRSLIAALLEYRIAKIGLAPQSVTNEIRGSMFTEIRHYVSARVGDLVNKAAMTGEISKSMKPGPKGHPILIEIAGQVAEEFHEALIRNELRKATRGIFSDESP
jgi:hypothetical protein